MLPLHQGNARPYSLNGQGSYPRRKQRRGRLAVRLVIFAALALVCTYGVFAVVMFRRSSAAADSVQGRVHQDLESDAAPDSRSRHLQAEEYKQPQQDQAHHLQQQQHLHQQLQEHFTRHPAVHEATNDIHHPDSNGKLDVQHEQAAKAVVSHGVDSPAQHISVHATRPSLEAHSDTKQASSSPQGQGFYSLSATTIDGVEQHLALYSGNVTLVVNVASACGYTDTNYKGLQATFDKYRKHGFTILGFPCNQFGRQEPGSEAEIHAFCTSKYHVTFPMFAKIDVNGPNTHPVYKYLKSQLPVSEGGGGGSGPGQDIGWNFYKFLVDQTGDVVKRFTQEYHADEVESAIYRLLFRKQ